MLQQLFGAILEKYCRKVCNLPMQSRKTFGLEIFIQRILQYVTLGILQLIYNYSLVFSLIKFVEYVD